MAKSRRADAFLQALLAHRTVREAAQAAGISERAAYLFLADPAFKALYKAAQDDLVRGVSNHLREQMNEAVDVIGEIMRDPENQPRDRLAAAKTVLEQGAKYLENTEIMERLRQLEEGTGGE